MPSAMTFMSTMLMAIPMSIQEPNTEKDILPKVSIIYLSLQIPHEHCLNIYIYIYICKLSKIFTCPCDESSIVTFHISSPFYNDKCC